MRGRWAIRALAAGALAAGAVWAGGLPELPALPSGQTIVFYERILPGDYPAAETAMHYRFVAPQIARAGGDIGIEQAADDMQLLCDQFALPMLEGAAPPERIIINLADREVPFGEANPEATQFFEAYRVEDGACIWEGF